jgi:cytochrome c oxidase subunit 3
MGIWLFGHEILFFGGLFALFIYRSWYFDSFVERITISTADGGAQHAVPHHVEPDDGALRCARRRPTIRSKRFACCLRPSRSRAPSGGEVLRVLTQDPRRPVAGCSSASGFTTEHPNVFFAIYFVMTGIHGLHRDGIGLILWVMFRAMKNEFSSRYYAPVEGVGLYWHLST